jgi:hypothetical protein
VIADSLKGCQVTAKELILTAASGFSGQWQEKGCQLTADELGVYS